MDESNSMAGSCTAEFTHSSEFMRHISPPILEAALTPIAPGATRPSLWSRIERKLKSGENTDVTVRIDNEQINCHLLALQCFSGFFEQEVPSRDQEPIELPGELVSPAAFRIIYEWILDPARRIEWPHFTAVLVAAKFLRIPALVERCWLHLDNPRVVDEVAFYVFLQARPFRDAQLQSMMLRRICRFFLALVSAPDFCDLSLEDLSVLLSSNIIGVFDETDVLFAVCLWLLYDWLERAELVDEAMELVRFGAMRKADLARFCVFRECPELQPILRHAATKKAVDNALAAICVSETGTENRGKDLHRIRLQAECGETLQIVNGERSFDRFIALLEHIRNNPPVWRSFRVIECEDVFGWLE
ncbi:kelch-like protein 8 [Anopheles cruzii]|uniref:kelch-like protein 8 n=1 Tax=Anopheles cruzii TaxID=68878 RepID=UPI0022EC37F1|nr:kelch-like protein 8 [Anopheles cruzii]